jgi:hypothetical protein
MRRENKCLKSSQLGEEIVRFSGWEELIQPIMVKAHLVGWFATETTLAPEVLIMKSTTGHNYFLRTPILVFTLTLLAMTAIGRAETKDGLGFCKPFTLEGLQKLNPCQLDHLFGQGQVVSQPVGLGRGRILWLTGVKRPQLQARLSGMVWKGKFFYPDGRFVNQWLGFRAVAAQVTVGPSWFDGQPCFIMEYPPGAAVFGNARDELREIAPGLFLGRYNDRCPCPKLRGYFVLDFRCSCAGLLSSRGASLP